MRGSFFVYEKYHYIHKKREDCNTRIIYTINMYYISAKGTAPIDLKKQLIPTRITLLFIIVINIFLKLRS